MPAVSPVVPAVSAVLSAWLTVESQSEVSPVADSKLIMPGVGAVVPAVSVVVPAWLAVRSKSSSRQ